jgi:O-glycosyl hydrolase
VALLGAAARAQTVTVDGSAAGRRQTIDGFGTCLSGTEAQSAWWQELFYDDLGASILRVDITPRFRSPYSDHVYNSPWFGNSPALPGPEGNNVRTYTGPADYSRTFAGQSAPIAVMGSDIEKNLLLFDFAEDGPKTAGAAAQAGLARRGQLGDFKLVASMWSPAPWVKVTSGATYGGGDSPLPPAGVAWPFIWGGNFAGGKLDVSGQALAVFDDGTGPTSALTQFARGLAAYLRGFQRTFGVSFHAVSIQNELTFEEFYSSCTYPQSSAYATALKAARAELDKYDDLRGIVIMGPEDLLGGDAYALWQYGGGADVTHKNLQFLQTVGADADAARALGFFNVHGYAPDGVSSAGVDPVSWDRWQNGWGPSPAAGIPANVKGFAGYGKKSWMTETSGESDVWLAPASGFPGNGAWSIALKIHQALTTGGESAWIYWQLSDGSAVSAQTLTDAAMRAQSPKYVAAKHFFKLIRPGAVRLQTAVAGATDLAASAYLDERGGPTLTVVLVSQSAAARTVSLAAPAGYSAFTGFASSAAALWQPVSATLQGAAVPVPVPGWGVVTVTATRAGSFPDAGPGQPDARPGQADAGPGQPPGGADAPAASAHGDATGGCAVAGRGDAGPLGLVLLVGLLSACRRSRATRARAPRDRPGWRWR